MNGTKQPSQSSSSESNPSNPSNPASPSSQSNVVFPMPGAGLPPRLGTILEAEESCTKRAVASGLIGAFFGELIGVAKGFHDVTNQESFKGMNAVWHLKKFVLRRAWKYGTFFATLSAVRCGLERKEANGAPDSMLHRIHQEPKLKEAVNGLAAGFCAGFLASTYSRNIAFMLRRGFQGSLGVSIAAELAAAIEEELEKTHGAHK